MAQRKKQPDAEDRTMKVVCGTGDARIGAELAVIKAAKTWRRSVFNANRFDRLKLAVDRLIACEKKKAKRK